MSLVQCPAAVPQTAAHYTRVTEFSAGVHAKQSVLSGASIVP